MSPNPRAAALVGILLIAYIAVIHFPLSSYHGVIGFLVCKRCAYESAAPYVYTALPYGYVCLPALILVGGLLLGSLTLIAAARVLALVLVVVAFFLVLIAPLLVGIAGTRANALITLLVAVSVLSWHLLVFAWARRLRRDPDEGLRMGWRQGLIGAPVIVLIAWSLSSGVSAARQAYRIAGGRPYCIATTDAGKPITLRELAAGTWHYGPIKALEALRGTRLYTSATGYKDNSRWYFHAVLIVDAQGHFEYWNWSSARTKFEPIHRPTHFIASIRKACEPVPDFLSRLSLL